MLALKELGVERGGCGGRWDQHEEIQKMLSLILKMTTILSVQTSENLHQASPFISQCLAHSLW
jgi:hypothetical protein